MSTKDNYMVGHYAHHLWGAPWSDNHSMVQPKRVTPKGGARNLVSIFGENYYLPTKDERYHCYSIGQISGYTFNLFKEIDWTQRGYWYNMAEYCQEYTVEFQFYNKYGITYPLGLIWFTVTEDKNLVLVLKVEDVIPIDFDEEDLYFKTYRMNPIPSPSTTVTNTVNGFKIVSAKINTSSDIRTIQREWDKLGATKMWKNRHAYVNGLSVSSLWQSPPKVGDYVEISFMSNLEVTTSTSLRSLNTFESTVDQIRKYLYTHVHGSLWKNGSYNGDVMYYQDDVDFYLLAKDRTNNAKWHAAYIQKNHPSTVRQVGNMDYSISVNAVQEIMTKFPDLFNVNKYNMEIRAEFKYSANTRKMPFNANRIHELNRLPGANRVAALTGYRSNVSFWKAQNLEASALMQAVSSVRPKCNGEDIEAIYGYNGITYYTGRSVHPREEFILDRSGKYLVNVPYNIRKYSSVFEYDENGRMLGWSRFGDYNQYIVKDALCHYVEFIGAVGTRQPNDFINQNQITIPSDWEVRVYLADELQTNNVSAWEDVTKSSDVVIIKDGDRQTVRYDGNLTRKELLIRTDRDFLCREVNVPIVDGIISFTMTNTYVRIGSNHPDIAAAPIAKRLVEQKCRIPYGQLDVFLNGNALIEGIDYFVNFPHVVITNKEYLKQNSKTQKVMYRAMSFPKADLSPLDYREVGYVAHGQLSRDNTYDIISDKNLLIKVGGGIIAKEKLGFSELKNHISVNRNGLEGKPYEIRDVIVPKRNVYDKDTYEFREESFRDDKIVSDYMSQFIRDSRETTTPTQQNKYHLFSPLLSRLIEKCLNDDIGFEKIDGQYTNDELIKYIERYYQPLFSVDPFFNNHFISKHHVEIHPTYKNTISTLSYYHYHFIRRVIEVYYRNEVSLSHFIRIGEVTNVRKPNDREFTINPTEVGYNG